MTRRLVTSPSEPDAGVVQAAAELLRAGAVVAIPTETVYGLAADATNAVAVGRIFEAKGRPAYNPLIVHLADPNDLELVASAVPDRARALASAFWPGPLTMVLRRRDIIADLVTGGRDTVGVRVPAHPVARAIIRAAGVPLAAPSANRFTEVSPTTADHVVRGLGGRIPLVVDAGPCTVGIESTVVDLTTDPPTLLRPGGTSREAIEALIGPLAAAAAPARADEVRAAPGMIDRHYSPRARVVPFDMADTPTVREQAAAALARGEQVTIVTRVGEDAQGDLVMPRDPAAYAQRLYDMLHQLDERGFKVAWVARPPATPDWEAVRDRLERAAAPTVFIQKADR